MLDILGTEGIGCRNERSSRFCEGLARSRVRTTNAVEARAQTWANARRVHVAKRVVDRMLLAETNGQSAWGAAAERSASSSHR